MWRDYAEEIASDPAQRTIQKFAPLIALQIVEEMHRGEFSEGLPTDLEHASERADINMYGAEFAARLLFGGTHDDDIAAVSDYLEAAQAIVDAFLRTQYGEPLSTRCKHISESDRLGYVNDLSQPKFFRCAMCRNKITIQNTHSKRAVICL